MTTLKIKVTKDILEKSKWCGRDGKAISFNCAVSLAVRDIFKNGQVDGEYFYPRMGKYYGLGILLPHGTQCYVRSFDRSSPSERLHLPEHEFEVSIPDQIVNQINIDELRPLLENHPTLELILNK